MNRPLIVWLNLTCQPHLRKIHCSVSPKPNKLNFNFTSESFISRRDIFQFLRAKCNALIPSLSFLSNFPLKLASENIQGDTVALPDGLLISLCYFEVIQILVVESLFEILLHVVAFVIDFQHFSRYWATPP